MGQSLEAFGQWKTLVSFLFSCNRAVSNRLFCTLLTRWKCYFKMFSSICNAGDMVLYSSFIWIDCNLLHVAVSKKKFVIYRSHWNPAPSYLSRYENLSFFNRLFYDAILGSWTSFLALQQNFLTTTLVQFLDILYWQLKQGLKGSVFSTQSPTVDDSWFTDDIFLRHHYKVKYEVLTGFKSLSFRK